MRGKLVAYGCDALDHCERLSEKMRVQLILRSLRHCAVGIEVKRHERVNWHRAIIKTYPPVEFIVGKTVVRDVYARRARLRPGLGLPVQLIRPHAQRVVHAVCAVAEGEGAVVEPAYLRGGVLVRGYGKVPGDGVVSQGLSRKVHDGESAHRIAVGEHEQRLCPVRAVLDQARLGRDRLRHP